MGRRLEGGAGGTAGGEDRLETAWEHQQRGNQLSTGEL